MVRELCIKASAAAQSFFFADANKCNEILIEIKKGIEASVAEILRENKKDVAKATENGKDCAFIDRLTLTEKRVLGMAEGVGAVISLPNVVGETVEEYSVPSGLNIKKVRAPLGVVGIIYEARPNVTVDAAVLCIKTSNAVILRGSKDAVNTNKFLADLMRNALKKCGCDENLVCFLEGEDREITRELLRQEGLLDVIIPRGGEALKKFVLANALVPVIASAGGNCHAYAEKTCDFVKAIKVIVNAKVQRPSVCNALETLLCDRAIAKEFLPLCVNALREQKVELRGDQEVAEIIKADKIIDEQEYYVEYNDLIIKIKLVDGVDEAVKHINTYGTNHSEAILTGDMAAAERFTRSTDSAAVYVNASTRFTDGFEFGLGAEMGISTQKLHVRGPIGLKELTSVKYVVTGDGTVRK